MTVLTDTEALEVEKEVFSLSYVGTMDGLYADIRLRSKYEASHRIPRPFDAPLATQFYT